MWDICHQHRPRRATYMTSGRGGWDRDLEWKTEQTGLRRDRVSRCRVDIPYRILIGSGAQAAAGKAPNSHCRRGAFFGVLQSGLGPSQVLNSLHRLVDNQQHL